MNDTTRSAVIAVLAILAVTFAAATLDSTVTPEQSSSSGPGSDGERGEGDGGLFPLPESDSSPGETLPIPFLAILAGIAGLAILLYLLVYRREALTIAIVTAALLSLLFILLSFLSSPTHPPTPPTEPGNVSLFGGGGDSKTTQPSPPSLVVLLFFGLALAGTIAALYRTTFDESDERVEDSPNTAAVGRAAGRAADRLEQEADVDNEVYRAWREMTDLLDVPDPETSTPGEFADAAIEAGLGREDVDELTRLFEDIRYGDTQPSDEHEQQAVTIFRRVEGRYAEDES